MKHQQTISDIGAGQGVALIDGKVYLYGDAETGIIREYTWNEKTWSHLKPTGVVIRLTRHGEDIAQHPTGLTHHPEVGTFLGDTVNQKGTIFHINWTIAIQDGNLDNAVLNMVSDDIAFNGTCPEFVHYKGRWLIATSDYGEENNQVRLYDPQRLKTAVRTSAPKVVLKSWPCGPWVQTVHWMPKQKRLVLAQNQTAGLKYRLTFLDLESKSDFRQAKTFDISSPVDELEGFAFVGKNTGLFLSSSRTNNVHLGKVVVDVD